MPIVLQLPAVNSTTEERPSHCPYCRGETFQRWGQYRKPLKDPRVRAVAVYRYRCTHCQRTFRHYPAGVGRAQQSVRMKKLAVVCWAFGLSYRAI